MDKIPYKVIAAYEGHEVDSYVGLTGEEAAPLVENGSVEFVAPRIEKHTITQEDLDANAPFVEEGLSVGDEVELPVYDREVLEAIGVDTAEIEKEAGVE